MLIMSVNTGSSSLKFSLFDFTDKTVIATGLFERIGIEGSEYKIKYNEEKYSEVTPLETHVDAVKILVHKLIELGIVESMEEIQGVGHRIVQGIDRFNSSIRLTDEIIDEIEGFNTFAPLHNPPAISGIRAFKKILPDTPMVGVFDTAFHQSMSVETFLYPVPMRWYQDYSVRKYGFHGINHQYVANVFQHQRLSGNFKLINCHIGSGASVCAINKMACVDTSMGFTPLSGLMMGSRSGDIDPSIIPYIMEVEGKSADEVIKELNKESGLLGISGESSDMRDILELCDEGDRNAIIVRKMFVRRVVNYIAQYFVLLGGADIISFTGGIGENSEAIRNEICSQLECLGLLLDPVKNQSHGEFTKISTRHSKVEAYIVPANEELMIGIETHDLLFPRKDRFAHTLLEGWM